MAEDRYCKICGHKEWLEGIHSGGDRQTNECPDYNKIRGACGCTG